MTQDAFRPDRFFDAAQIARLRELMDAQRQANAANTPLPPGETAELAALINAELYASADRAALLADREP